MSDLNSVCTLGNDRKKKRNERPSLVLLNDLVEGIYYVGEVLSADLEGAELEELGKAGFDAVYVSALELFVEEVPSLLYSCG
ncbi:hypothetical protein KDK67_10980, partial [Methanococcoides seepicolus]|nr:hypothetical protein [Methanococcoides seepicolus]